MFYIAIPRRTRGAAEANNANNGSKASNRAVNGGIKNTPSNSIPEAVQVGKPAQKQGTKRKNNHLETEENNSVTAPSKKAKPTKETPKSTSARITPRPIVKGKAPAAAPSNAGKTSKDSKKRPNPTDDSDGIVSSSEKPKTPAPPIKKSRVDKNELSKGKSQPIRRTGMYCLFDLEMQYL